MKSRPDPVGNWKVPVYERSVIQRFSEPKYLIGCFRCLNGETFTMAERVTIERSILISKPYIYRFICSLARHPPRIPAIPQFEIALALMSPASGAAKQNLA